MDAIGIIPVIYYILDPDFSGTYIDFLILLKIKHFSQTLSRLDYYLSY